MKNEILLLALIFMTLQAGLAASQVSYEFEIEWRNQAGWKSLSPYSIQVIDGEVVAGHKYWMHGLGEAAFEAPVYDSAQASPRKVVFKISVKSIPDNQLIGFYRMRLRGKSQNVYGLWSEPSEWVGVIGISPQEKNRTNS